MANLTTGVVSTAKDISSYSETTVNGVVTSTTTATNTINTTVTTISGSASGLVQDADMILSNPIEGLGGTGLLGKGNADGSTINSGANSDKDYRIKLRAQPLAIEQVYGPNNPSNILAPLHTTNGMLFPYTPSIEWSQQVEYKQTSLTHSNQDYLSYSNTPSTSLEVSGDFTVQNQQEGEYLIAVMHFLRTVSKMYFGKPIDGYPSGMPPPVLLFSGYGNYMFNDLPVIVKSHRFSLAKDVDYVNVKVGNGNLARLPTVMSISVSLTVQNTPRKQREEFNLDKFRTGELMRNGNKGWI